MTDTVHFYKYQGLGNDFILFDAEPEGLLDPAHPSWIRKLCDRRFGIGADGILFAAKPKSSGAIRMAYYNADGSFAETCFNGLRCTGLHAVRTGRAAVGKSFVIESPTGLVSAVYASPEEGVRMQLAGPNFDPARVPVAAGSPVIDSELTIAGRSMTGTALSIGNPHFVAWESTGGLEWLNERIRSVGGAVEKDPIFPRAVNFELAHRINPTEIEMAVWERGVGPTLACGSGATSTVCAGVKTGRLAAEKPVTVHMAGGDLRIIVAEDLSLVTVIGGADFVFEGEIPAVFLGR